MRSVPYYVTARPLAEKLGMTLKEWEAVRPRYEKAGLPLRDPLCGRRYLAAVEAFLDRHNRLDLAEAQHLPSPIEVENFDAVPSRRAKRNHRALSPGA